MSLTLYNTLTRKKERFDPIDPTNVRMYACGPTVYDYAHIGNARPIIVFDVLFRLLRHIYGPQHVTYARNITDVDDKINNRAVERFPDMEPTAAIRRLTEETAAQFHKDIAALGVLPPTVEPRATEHIEEMKALCEVLVARGHAYVSHDHVLFDASSMADYGRLANRSLEEMEAGARVDVAPYKKGPTDFVLWKPSTPAQPGWPSPCGIAAPGRPGWHIECSAMADKWLWSEPKLKGLLSEAGLARPHVFDIHAGGIDLVFPHHENEIAQSRCAHGTPVMANYWLHNGFLQVEGEKMSKSLGNFVTINELLETERFGGRRWPGEVLRLAMLMTHYRDPIDFSIRRLQEAETILTQLYRRFASIWPVQEEAPDDRVIERLKDDLNTYAAINTLRWSLNDGTSGQMMAGFTPLGYSFAANAGKVLGAARMLGLLQSTPADWLQSDRHIDDEKIQALITARLEARKRKDFKEGDRIRDELAAMGIQLKDTKSKETGEIETTWEVKR